MVVTLTEEGRELLGVHPFRKEATPLAWMLSLHIYAIEPKTIDGHSIVEGRGGEG